jgi:hypothetical protein
VEVAGTSADMLVQRSRAPSRAGDDTAVVLRAG